MTAVWHTHSVQMNFVQFSVELIMVQGLNPNPSESNGHNLMSHSYNTAQIGWSPVSEASPDLCKQNRTLILKRTSVKDTFTSKLEMKGFEHFVPK